MDLNRHYPRIACCGENCGDTCKCCCDNVRYADKLNFTFVNQWGAVPPDGDYPGCDAGSASVSFDLTSVYADKDPFTEEFTELRNHPCTWQRILGWPDDLGTLECGDITVDGICSPGNGFPGCFDVPYKITEALFYCICQVAPQPVDSPYSGMNQIGDGQTPAQCTVSAGTSRAGWVGQLGITSGDCINTGTGVCALGYLINRKGPDSSVPGSLDPFRTFGYCSPCDPWRCCDPFFQRYYLGAWVLTDPEDLSIWPYGSDVDRIDCEHGIAHIQGNDVPLSEIPYVDITATHTCTPRAPVALLGAQAQALITAQAVKPTGNKPCNCGQRNETAKQKLLEQIARRQSALRSTK